jgi:hypothetical protein
MAGHRQPIPSVLLSRIAVAFTPEYYGLACLDDGHHGPE